MTHAQCIVAHLACSVRGTPRLDGNAPGTSASPMPGLSHWNTSFRGSKSLKPGNIRNKGLLLAGRYKLTSCAGAPVNSASCS
eukprot:2757349-Lingulodinium_polyedra.AAC.1